MHLKDSRGFTLIELLVVIAIIAILSVVIILVLNPTELLKQSRDSSRLSDMTAIHTALSTFLADQPSGSLGTASTLYLSIPDSTTTCANLGLPTPSSSWSYHCAPSSTLRNVDGTGWIPVNLTSVSTGAPISHLPIDPINTTSTYLYYTYTTQGNAYKMTATTESQKYLAKEVNDGGIDMAAYETGTDFTLNPFIRGLVGYWKFDEGSGNAALDSSGFGHAGTWIGFGSRYAAGKVGAYTGIFNGANDYVSVGNASQLQPQTLSVGVWFNPSVLSTWNYLVDNTTTGDYTRGYRLEVDSSGDLYFAIGNGSALYDCQYNSAVTIGNWYHLFAVYDGSSINLYVNGSLKQTCSKPNVTINYTGASFLIGNGNPGNQVLVNGKLDDVRVYSRALSAAEIATL